MLLFALLDFFLSPKISEKTVLFLVHFRENTDRWPIAKVRLIRAEPDSQNLLNPSRKFYTFTSSKPTKALLNLQLFL